MADNAILASLAQADRRTVVKTAIGGTMGLLGSVGLGSSRLGDEALAQSTRDDPVSGRLNDRTTLPVPPASGRNHGLEAP